MIVVILPKIKHRLAPVIAAFIMICGLLHARPLQEPVMTVPMRQELFTALNLDAPEMGEVKQAFYNGDADFSEAIHAFANYLRQRTAQTWVFRPSPTIETSERYNTRKANNGVIGVIIPSDLPGPEYDFGGNTIDWALNATGGASGWPLNNEWQWQLNRMSWWVDMAQAYRVTKDERYAKAWAEQMRSFILHNPPPANVNDYKGDALTWGAGGVNYSAGSTWRTIECGIRMRSSWPHAFHSFVLSPSLSDEDLALFAYSVMQHANYLMNHHSSGGNWLTMEMSGLYSAGIGFPEFLAAENWRMHALETVSASQQFLADGVHAELTPAYHNVALDNIVVIAQIANRVGRLAELPADYLATVEKAYDTNLLLMTPDRSLPRLNDSWTVNIPEKMRHALGFFPQREDYLWVFSDGKKGEQPALTSHAFEDSGYYVMRSGWGRDANYALFDAGPLGSGHEHQDKLNLVLWAYGREILFDSGGGSYEKTKWRDYAIDTFSHNTALVDGLPQRRHRSTAVQLSSVWESTPEYDFAAGVYDDGYGKPDDLIATHARRVLFIKPDIFIVVDTLTPNDEDVHTYQIRWHLLSTQIQEDGNTFATVDQGMPNLALVSLDTTDLESTFASAQVEPELLGWDIRKDMEPQYVPATTVLHNKSGKGTKVFVTALLPLRPGQSNPLVRTESVSPTEMKLVFDDGRSFELSIPVDPSERVTMTEL